VAARRHRRDAPYISGRRRSPSLWPRRLLLLGSTALGLALLIVVIPIGWVETQCRPGARDASVTTIAPAPVSQAPFRPVIDTPPHRRELARSYLSYPQWQVVHAYQDLASVLASQDEAVFDYAGQLSQYWTSLCGLTRFAAALGATPAQWRATLYPIGAGFSIEMIAKGGYETTIGRLTAWLRGDGKTAEDRFALELARDHATFLQQRRWHNYPFFGMLGRFWAQTPLSGSGGWHWLRKIERRFALSVELAAKGVLATGTGWLSSTAPEDLRIRSVVRGLPPKAGGLDKQISMLRTLPDGRVVIETPRYRAFTGIVRGLLEGGHELTEIAGNERVLITVLVPEGKFADSPVAVQLFAMPVQSRAGWRRVGLDASIPALGLTIANILGAGGVFEHLYDY